MRDGKGRRAFAVIVAALVVLGVATAASAHGHFFGGSAPTSAHESSGASGQSPVSRRWPVV